ncbi:MAG: glycosyltransferase, partial [Actinobacteria bacterium]|nr:glycosyltransferase [Actinomycetota bacterium]
VRAVVLNWNSAWFTRRCIESLQRTDYPADRFEIVLVDNGSVDGSLERLRSWFPDLRIVANGANLGFAEGCNRGMRDRRGVDAVALVNNDAVVEPGWLTPLVDALVADPTIGAASARLVLEPGFIPVDLDAAHDVGVRHVRTDGIDVTAALRFEGFDAVSDAAWPLAVTHRLRSGRGRIWVPASSEVREVSLDFDGPVRVSSPGAEATGGSPVRSATIGVDAVRVNLLNGIGTARNARCEGYDRCFGVPEGDLDEEARQVIDVQGVCGGGALLRSAMLDDVGLLDARLFAYYEDTDLSWRASRAGWRVVAVPASRIEHAFGAAGGSRAAGFFHLDRRNWWLTAERNGTEEQRRTVRREVRREVWTAVRANIAGRLKRRRAPSLALIGAWVRIIADHRIERTRRDHPSRALPGARQTTQVLGRFQPRPTPAVPAPRPWGPVPVRVDVTDLVDGGVRPSTAATWRSPLDRLAARATVRTLLQDHPELDLTAVVVDGSGVAVVAGPREIAELLGSSPVGPVPADDPMPAVGLRGPVLRVRPGGPTEPVISDAGRGVVEAGPDASADAIAAELSVAGRTIGSTGRAGSVPPSRP